MPTPQELLARFLGYIERDMNGATPGKQPPGKPADADRDLAQLLVALIEEGRAAWPDLEVSTDDYMRYLAARLPKDETLAGGLSAVHGADLYLACACALGVPGAVAAFERRLLVNLPSFVGHLSSAPEFADEVGQLLREKLFVAPRGSTPKIADYSGRGALASWVRVAALRTALSLRRSQNAQRIVGQPSENDDDTPNLPLRRDPEMDYIKDRYRKEFKAAFHEAFNTLTVEQRNVLRLHYVDGLNIDRIGVMFRVHRSTVARWLSASCAQVLDETRRLLRERLSLSPTEFDSLAGVIRSQLDLSIIRYLRDSSPSNPS
jgi:RNA polymerase sigma-70 factor (ECF subfamily)